MGKLRTVLIALGAALAGFAAVLLADIQSRPAEIAPTGPTRAQQIDNAIAAAFTDSQALGMVVAVVRGDDTEVRGFGHLAPGDPRTPDGHTLVRLQSVSKLFAANLLAAQVAKGAVKLEDPLARYTRLPWTVSRGQGVITLQQLATHISGLPRDDHVPTKLSEAAARQARQVWLEGQHTLFPPGVQAQYSNAAYDLLGDVLATTSHSSYGQQLASEITGPLGMVDTTATPTPEQCARMLVSDPGRHPWPCVDQAGEAASGGLYSTAGDMALWLKAQLAPPGPGRDWRTISQTVYVQRDALRKAIGLDHAGMATGIALAWLEEPPAPNHPRILEKTGGGDGFLAYVAIDPAARVGVFVAFDNVVDHRLGVVTADVNALVGFLGERPKVLAAR